MSYFQKMADQFLTLISTTERSMWQSARTVTLLPLHYCVVFVLQGNLTLEELKATVWN